MQYIFLSHDVDWRRQGPQRDHVLARRDRFDEAVKEYLPDKDKVSRVYAASPMIESGRVWLPKNKRWADDLVTELLQFPNAAHDDQVDALSITLDVLSRTSISVDAWDLQGDVTQSLNHTPSIESSFGKSLKLKVNKALPKWAGWGAL